MRMIKVHLPMSTLLRAPARGTQELRLEPSCAPLRREGRRLRGGG